MKARALWLRLDRGTAAAPRILLVCGVIMEFILYPLSAIDWGCVLHPKALLAVSGSVDEAF